VREPDRYGVSLSLLTLATIAATAYIRQTGIARGEKNPVMTPNVRMVRLLLEKRACFMMPLSFSFYGEQPLCRSIPCGPA
jgi:hypothetical protein